eukprot:gene975-58148_t
MPLRAGAEYYDDDTPAEAVLPPVEQGAPGWPAQLQPAPCLPAAPEEGGSCVHLDYPSNPRTGPRYVTLFFTARPFDGLWKFSRNLSPALEARMFGRDTTFWHELPSGGELFPYWRSALSVPGSCSAEKITHNCTSSRDTLISSCF